MRKKVKLKLTVNYTDDYPDSLPELGLETVDGELDDSESSALLKGLLDVVSCAFWFQRLGLWYLRVLQGEENKGMAMTFTLVSHLREELSGLVENRVKVRIAEEHERERLAIEVRSHLDPWPRLLVDCRVGGGGTHPRDPGHSCFFQGMEG